MSRIERAYPVSGVPKQFPPLPRDTAYMAEMVVGTQNIYLAIGDQAERLLAGLDLAPLDSVGNQLWTRTMCLMVTVLQHLENLPDQRAVDATRTRQDWKYALHLPARYPGFNGRQLCEFRQQLWQQPAARGVLQHVLDRLTGLGLPTTAANEVLDSVCAISRLERLIEALHLVLEAVAATAPEWLRTVTRPHWYERYHRQHLTHVLPRSRAEQVTLAHAINADAVYLLEALTAIKHQPEVLKAVQDLWQEWERQFSYTTEELVWRDSACACIVGCGLSCPSWRAANRLHIHFAG